MDQRPSLRLIATDLDHTLLDRDERIAQEAAFQLMQLKERGIGLTLVSGRPIPFMMHLADQLEIDLPMVALNGAVLFTREGVLETRSIRMAPLRELLLEAHGLGVTILYYTPTEAFAFAETPWVESQKDTIRRYKVHLPQNKDWEEVEVLKVSIIFHSAVSASSIISPKVASLAGCYGLNHYDTGNFEISQAGVDKGQGLKRISEILAIPMTQIMALGDEVNDVEMLRTAGVGVVVANAAQEAKEHADYVTRAERTLGVLEAIDCFA